LFTKLEFDHIAEESDTNEECGIHATTFISLLILGQFTVADFWIPHSGHFRCGLYYTIIDINSIVLKIFQKS